ncbi:MAG TPA: GGDEF domain-containing protein [Rhodanobacteraceae bacterium]|nr:GGDEF domain-containing protein [Rhodanobacteraceae bacterium]
MRALVLLLLGLSCAWAMATPDVASRLSLADSVKTTNHAQFAELLAQLEQKAEQMGPERRWYLRYLQGWESGYNGEYSTAVEQLTSVLDGAKDPLLRFRAGVSLVNVQAVSLHYDDAFKTLVTLLGEVDRIKDEEALTQFYGTAAILYNKVGEYTLAVQYADRLIERGGNAEARCKGMYLRMAAHYKSTGARLDPTEVDLAEKTCNRAGDPVFDNATRVLVAQAALNDGDAKAAIAGLMPFYADATATGYAELVADFNSTLASAWLAAGDRGKASDYARRVVDGARAGEHTEALADALNVLYLATKQEGQTTAALAWLEKYMAADRGYLNEVGVRSLAYERVKQQVAGSRSQTQTAEKQNKILELQRSLAQKAAETRGLYALLISMALLVMAIWIWRLKLSQRRLRTLAQRDSLTGIMNRQFFVYEAERVLQAAGRSGRTVSMVLIDLDHFKLVNDGHGHAAGDIVLKRAVHACKSHLRAEDLFGRVGGEEFAVILPDCPMPVALERAELLRNAIAAVGTQGNAFGIPLSASLGVATTARVGYQLNDLMIHADEAMYRAKARGRNTVVAADNRTPRMAGGG